jgi:2C-methyl-D-erythritol 2,4-cyclodiphosphate synthase
MAPHIPRMQEILGRNMGVAPTQVGVKATTSEHMGFTGRAEGIVAIAIVRWTCSAYGSAILQYVDPPQGGVCPA